MLAISLVACRGNPDRRDSEIEASVFDDGATNDDGATTTKTLDDRGAVSDDAGPNAGPDAEADTGPQVVLCAPPIPDAGTIADDVAFLPNVTVETVAGGALAGAADGTAAGATFANPVSVLIERAGTIVVCDFDNDSLRRVDLSTGTAVVTTLTKQAGFQRPYGLTLGSDGALYVDTDFDPAGHKNRFSGTVWRIDAATGAAVVIAADIGRPRGLALRGDQLVLGDYQNARVQLLDPVAMAVSELVGGACPPMLDGGAIERALAVPYGIVVLLDGRIVVADEDNRRLRSISAAGAVATYAGGEESGTVDGDRLAARFDHPTALAVDAAGDVFVSDVGAHRIRRIAADGVVTTVAGDGTGGFKDGAGAEAEFWGQEGLAVTSDGKTLFVADGTLGQDGTPYNRLRKITIGAATGDLPTP